MKHKLQVLFSKKKRGAPAGHPGYPGAGRRRGIEMPCGWGCGARLTNSEIRRHFVECPKRPDKNRLEKPEPYQYPPEDGWS